MSKPELTVVKDKENPLLRRREVTLHITHNQASTPTRSDIRQRLTGKFNVDPELVQITKMETKRSTWVTVCSAYIYSSKEAAQRLTPKHLPSRDLPKEEKEKLKAGKKKAGKPAKK